MPVQSPEAAPKAIPPPSRFEPAELPAFSQREKSLINWPTPPPPVVQPLSVHPAVPAPIPPSAPHPSALLHVPLKVVGVVGKLYVVLESDCGMVLMDQHAAHERILFEQMLNRLEQSGPAPSQRLLLPETVELTARDSQFLREQLPTLTRLGVGLAEFGERTFLLDALPPYVKAGNPRRFMLELVDEFEVRRGIGQCASPGRARHRQNGVPTCCQSERLARRAGIAESGGGFAALRDACTRVRTGVRR